MWWKNKIKDRVEYIDKNFNEHIKNVCKKILRSYPPVPLELNDLYNIVLYRIASDAKKYNGEYDINIFVLSLAKGFARNECRKFLSKKHRILSNSVPLDEEVFIAKDSISVGEKINIKDFSFIERLVLKMVYFDNLTKIKIMQLTKLSRRELEAIIQGIKFKIKRQL